MRISTIEIENFRNLRGCTLDLRAGLNVIVGRNDVGKSNAVRALRHALGPAAAAGDLPRLERTDFREVGDVPQPMKVTVQFTGLSQDDRTNFFEMLVPNLKAIEESEARLVFEATWTSRNRASTRRWCGPEQEDGAVVPHALLEALPITFLPALRDAEAALTPGYKNRLARLLDVLADADDRSEVVGIFETANKALDGQRLIKKTVEDVRGSAKRMSGTDFRQPSIKSAEPDITRILRTLRLTIDGAPVEDVGAANLGYQNILYVATVLAHLTKVSDGDCPLLIVEEPEAHLHPQLVVLLAESLSNHRPGGTQSPQTIVTTHSPTFTANVQPEQLIVMVGDSAGHGTARAVAGANLDKKEARAVQRMMDVTRSALYFAKGVILVEGISESLLVPALAKRLDKDLKRAHVSVVPICGVAFGTLEKLLHQDVLGIPVAIISDGDPKTDYAKDGDGDWHAATPKMLNGVFEVCDRLVALRSAFSSHTNVEVFASDVTLEYDLADAAEANPSIIAEVWESTFVGKPGTLNKSKVEAAENQREATLAVWRGICVASSAGSKADFAHRLAAELEDDDGIDTKGFVVPGYIEAAINHVLGSDPSAESDGDSE